MTLTGTNVGDYIAQALGRDSSDSNDGLSSEIPILSVVNQTGEWFFAEHEWNWLGFEEAHLRLRDDVTITSATGSSTTVSINTDGSDPDMLTEDNYAFVTGDHLEVILPATSAGFYEIASEAAGTLTMEDNSLDSVTITSAKIVTDSVALPSDFQSLLAVQHSEGLIRAVILSSPQEFLEHKTTLTSPARTSPFLVFVDYVTPVTAGAPVPVLRVYPSPTAEDKDGFTILYQRGWATLAAIGNTIPIPTWCELAFLEVAREIALGYEKAAPQEMAPISHRLAMVAAGYGSAGAAFMNARRRDGKIQNTGYGQIRNGMASQRGRSSTYSWYDAPVADF